MAKYEPLTAEDFDLAYPASKKIYEAGPHGVRVPMREIAVDGGKDSLRVYDTSGPRHFDVHAGLPPLDDVRVRQALLHAVDRKASSV